ncbi:MAG: SGNH/GDSL hydrolase family protein [Burkholderiaceae bacterium]
MHFEQSRRRLLGLVAASSVTVLLTACGGDGDPVFNPPVAGQKYSQAVVVGASISDTGNTCAKLPASCPPSPPYATGVYSNGPLWIQTVAANYKLAANPSLKGGTNYAYGGARTGAVPSPIAGAPALANDVPSMVQQLDTYFSTTGLRADPKALYVVDATTFGNNFNAAATAFATAAAAGQVPVANQAAYFTSVTAAAVTDVVGIVNKLYFAGARQVLVVNVPNLGVTPLLTGNGAAPSNPNAAAGTQLSGGFNQNLTAQFGAFASSWTGLNLKTFDTFTLNTQAAKNPASLGLTNGTAACLVAPTTTKPGSMCATPNTYFYWDSLHPTAATGKLFSDRVISLLGA